MGVTNIDLGNIMGPQGPAGPAGAKGLTGATGSQGIQGVQGPKGDKGDKGDTGPAGTNTNMTGATTSAAGKAGLAPAPAAGAATRYLRSDGTWSVPPDTNTVYTHPTGAGNNHIPAGGATGQVLKWSAAGAAVWAADNNTTYAAMKAATASAAGTTGLVPAPPAGAQSKYLRGDGTWAEAAGGSGNNSVLDLTPFASIMDDPTLNGTPIQITQQIVDTVKKAYEDKLSTGLFVNPLTTADSANCYVPISISRDQEEGITKLIIQLSLIFPSELLGMDPSIIAAYSALISVDYEALEAFAYVGIGFGGSGAGGGGVKLLPSGFVNLTAGTHNSAEISEYVGGVEGFNRIYDDLEVDSNKTNYCSYWLATPYGVLQSLYAFAQENLGNGDKSIGFSFNMPIINSSGGRRSTTITLIGVTMSTNGTFSSNPQDAIINCAREIFVNTTAPSSSTGEEGDIWIQYTP